MTKVMQTGVVNSDIGLYTSRPILMRHFRNKMVPLRDISICKIPRNITTKVVLHVPYNMKQIEN